MKMEFLLHSIFVCVILAKCENCLRKMTVWGTLLTLCMQTSKKREENLRSFLPSNSEVMLLTTNSRILFFVLPSILYIGHIFIVLLSHCYWVWCGVTTMSAVAAARCCCKKKQENKESHRSAFLDLFIWNICSEFV